MNFQDINIKLHSLVIFRNLLKDKVIKRLMELISCNDEDTMEQVSRYSAFASALLEESDNLTDYILNRVLEDENVYILKCAEGLKVSEEIEESLRYELKVLEEVSQLTAMQLRISINYAGFLASWNTSSVDFTSIYKDRIKHISTYGYGIFAKYHIFMIKDLDIIPVKYPDNIRISQLQGYESERKIVVDNTLALLKGKPAANVLLRGDAGTGKSSTVKAIANEFKDMGLRLIEVTKRQLRDMPAIMDRLSRNPLKFILFIDDLSFAKDDDDFAALKAILEGSVSTKANNVVIYATSNRRHLVKESFSDRKGDDIHINDTIQELLSLSDRFGLSVTFTKPDKKQYLEIVYGLADQYEVKLSAEELELEAERFALRHNGRSPRVARQFVEYLKSKEA
ncbi:MAG: ATP-binding protein [Clostridiales bacterium]|nr:ATP-binding protein [Clostridiales bacterium]